MSCYISLYEMNLLEEVMEGGGGGGGVVLVAASFTLFPLASSSCTLLLRDARVSSTRSRAASVPIIDITLTGFTLK